MDRELLGEIILALVLIAIAIGGIAFLVDFNGRMNHQIQSERKCLKLGYPDTRCMRWDCYCVGIEEGRSVVLPIK